VIASVTPIIRLAFASLLNRRATAVLTMLAIALSVMMLLGVEKLRRDAKDAFANTISGTDLIVGARSGSIQLLLYSVFRIGNATNNVSWKSFKALSEHPQVAWSVPLSLGDSHRGFRVLGTNNEYFQRYRFARKQSLAFAQGENLSRPFAVVLGARVAKELGYVIGEKIVLAHGSGAVSLSLHDEHPFEVAGILAPTGTPVDRTLHVSLESITAIHSQTPPRTQSKRDARRARLQVFIERPEDRDLTPSSITAMMLGVKSKVGIFRLLRDINQYEDEPLLAIIPGVALQELWDLLGVAENLLRLVSVMVVFSGLLGMLTVILASLESRRREMAVLRSVGARPVHVFALFLSEAAALTVVGVVAGIVLLNLAIVVGREYAAAQFGIQIPLALPTSADAQLLIYVVVAATAIGLVPAVRAYKMVLADGLSMKL